MDYILKWKQKDRIKTENPVIPYKTVFQWQLKCVVLEILIQLLK